MFARQIPPNFEVGNGKITGIPKYPSIFKSVTLTGDLASKSQRSVDTQRPLSVDLAKLPIQNSEEFEVGNGTITNIQKNPQFFESVARWWH